MSGKEALKKIQGVIASIDKKFGRNTVMCLGERPSGRDIPSFPSGSLAIDRALGIGGYPRGRLIEIYGPESSGKTTLTLHAIAEVQKMGGTCAFVDAEHALDVAYAEKLGVNVDQLLVAQPDHGEQALAIAHALVMSEAVDLVVIDSVAALVPKAELEGEVGDFHVGTQARMMSQAMRMLTGAASKTQSTLIFINQIRQKIGVTFGSPETTTGGNALKFFASVRIDIRKIGQIKKKDFDEPVGSRTRVRVIKNKMAPPFRIAEFDIIYGRGVVPEAELVDWGVEAGVLAKSGAWLSYGETRLGNGRDNAIEFLQANPAVATEIRQLLFASESIEKGSPQKRGDKKDEQAA
ncbi:MAG: recombinase RecA [Proteobacteria bacterium]|jgi:recombination protein RecA|nr:recombinase RecA [Pseudomonadota bacterium]NLN62323.1 recombinase RecA [Myxococcales bacterium]